MPFVSPNTGSILVVTAVREALTRITIELLKARAVEPVLAIVYLFACVLFVAVETTLQPTGATLLLCRIVAWCFGLLGIATAVHDFWLRVRSASRMADPSQVSGRDDSDAPSG